MILVFSLNYWYLHFGNSCFNTVIFLTWYWNYATWFLHLVTQCAQFVTQCFHFETQIFIKNNIFKNQYIYFLTEYNSSVMKKWPYKEVYLVVTFLYWYFFFNSIFSKTHTLCIKFKIDHIKYIEKFKLIFQKRNCNEIKSDTS